MRRELWTGIEHAMMILSDGAVHRTEEFLVLVDKRLTDHPWSQRVRTVGMLTVLGKILDFTNNQLKLVQVAQRGQSGLYQLQRRDFFSMPSVNRFEREHASTRTSSSQAQSKGQ